MKRLCIPHLVAGSVLVSIASCAIAQEALREALTEQSSMQQSSAEVQAQINALDDQTRQMLNEYRQTSAQAVDMLAYNEQLERLVSAQRAELADFEKQLGEIEVTKRQMLPLIIRMIDVLDEFVSLDMPFLENERRLRVSELKALMDRPDVPTSEKYRRASEAYQIELEYGHTIEGYEGEITEGDATRTVAFLRFGRLGLYYMTLDGVEIGYWDKQQDRWVQLGDEYRQPLDRALRIARKQLPPDLIRLPVPAPEHRS